MAEKMAISTVPASPIPSTPQPQRDYAYYQGVFRGRALPFAYLDLDLLEQNIRQIVARAGGKRIRLASKSLRSVAVLRRILSADPGIQGITCYTAREAAYLAKQGFNDLLIGYPCWHEQDIAAVAQATLAGTTITLMVDSIAHVEQIERVAARHQFAVHFPVECRFVHADDIWLSPAYQRESAYVAVHMYRGMPYQDYFHRIEEIFKRYQGRPHWGKMHTQTAESLAALYPRWHDFRRVRASLDPQGIFLNDYLRQLFDADGPLPSATQSHISTAERESS